MQSSGMPDWHRCTVRYKTVVLIRPHCWWATVPKLTFQTVPVFLIRWRCVRHQTMSSKRECAHVCQCQHQTVIFCSLFAAHPQVWTAQMRFWFGVAIRTTIWALATRKANHILSIWTISRNWRLLYDSFRLVHIIACTQPKRVRCMRLAMAMVADWVSAMRKQLSNRNWYQFKRLKNNRNSLSIFQRLEIIRWHWPKVAR